MQQPSRWLPATSLIRCACSAASKGKQSIKHQSSRNFAIDATASTSRHEQPCGYTETSQRRCTSTSTAPSGPKAQASIDVPIPSSFTNQAHSPSKAPKKPNESSIAHIRSALVRPIRLIPPMSRYDTDLQKRSREKSRTGPSTSSPARVQLPTVRERDVAKLYALQSPPSLQALAALAERISPTLLGSRSGNSAEHNLAAIEQCCICDTFWQAVAENSPSQPSASTSNTDHSSVSTSTQISSLPTSKRYTTFHDATRHSNESLSTLGNQLLGTFALEWVESRYPHLPERVVKAALTLFVGPRTCADIASKQWGLTAGQAARQAFLGQPAGVSSTHEPGSPLRGVGEGNRGGTGLLRWAKLDSLDSLTQRGRAHHMEVDPSRAPLPLEEAMATAARAIVGLVFQEHGFAACREFVHSNFMTRKADIASLLKFPNPKLTLAATLVKFGRERPLTRLIAETGRLSIAPVFVAGVYSGSTKLGEGYGSSIAMSEFRANEDALRRLYLSPLHGDPLRSTFGEASGLTQLTHVDAFHQPALPTDTLVFPGRKYSKALPLLDDEVIWQSSGRSGVVANNAR